MSKPSGPSGMSSSTGPTPRPRPFSASSASRPLRLAGGRRPADLLLRPGGHRLADVLPGGPPPLCRHATPGRAPLQARGSPRSVRSGPDGGSSPPRAVAAFDLENTLVDSNVVDSYAWLATRHLPPARRIHWRPIAAGGAAHALARQARPGRLPALVLPPLRGRPGRQGSRRRLGAVQRPAAGPSAFPAGDRPGARAPRPRAPDPAHHRSARLRHRAAPATVRRGRLRPLGEEKAVSRELVRRPRPARRGRSCSATRPPRTALDLEWTVAYADSTSDLPMLEAAGSRSPSTPRPSWRPSPASAAGTSSTGAPRAAGSTAISIAARASLPLAPGARATPGTSKGRP